MKYNLLYIGVIVSLVIVGCGGGEDSSDSDIIVEPDEFNPSSDNNRPIVSPVYLTVDSSSPNIARRLG